MPHAVKLELRQLFQDKAGVAAPIEGESLQAKAKPAVVAKSAAVAATIPMGEIWRGLHKLGHVVSFALLAIVAGWAWPRQLWRRTCFYLTVFAGISETLQLLTPDRSAQLFDMGLNLFGIMAGLILWHFLSRLQYFAAPDPPTA